MVRPLKEPEPIAILAWRGPPAYRESRASSEGPLYDAIAGVLFGLLPLVAGTYGFFRGIRRLNR